MGLLFSLYFGRKGCFQRLKAVSLLNITERPIYLEASDMVKTFTNEYTSNTSEYDTVASLLETGPASVGAVVRQVLLLAVCFGAIGGIIAAASVLLS